MKKINTDGKDGFLHLIGEFDKVRVKQDGEVLDVPRWIVNVFFSDTKRKPDENAVEDDRIEFWVQKILVAQDGGFVFYADGGAPLSDTFHLSTILPLSEEIYIFEIEKDRAKITGHEDRE